MPRWQTKWGRLFGSPTLLHIDGISPPPSSDSGTKTTHQNPQSTSTIKPPPPHQAAVEAAVMIFFEAVVKQPYCDCKDARARLKSHDKDGSLCWFTKVSKYRWRRTTFTHFSIFKRREKIGVEKQMFCQRAIFYKHLSFLNMIEIELTGKR